MQANRCHWCTEDQDYIHYHDTVWGRPTYDKQDLFKKLCLDGQQAGLSWITILKKQPNYEAAFFDFDPPRMAALTEQDVERLMQNVGIVRNRLKIKSLINNARAYLEYEQQGDFSELLWDFVAGKPIQNAWQDKAQVPAVTPESTQMSKRLKKLGFTFVGPTICYAFMQATGMVNDHLVSCPSYSLCRQLGV